MIFPVVIWLFLNNIFMLRKKDEALKQYLPENNITFELKSFLYEIKGSTIFVICQRIRLLFEIRCYFATLYPLVTNGSLCVAFYASNAQKRNAFLSVGIVSSNAYMGV
jgi:hypothetical protein